MLNLLTPDALTMLARGRAQLLADLAAGDPTAWTVLGIVIAVAVAVSVAKSLKAGSSKHN